MKIIPVLDLKDGEVVIGKPGERSSYAPVESKLTDSSKPLQVATAFKEKLGLRSFYLADLNSIMDEGDNFSVIKRIKKGLEVNLIADLGIKKRSDLENKIISFLDRIVVASETVEDLKLFSEALSRFDKDKVIASIDIECGDLLTGLEFNDAESLIQELMVLGIKNFILIDLRRVGSRSGISDKIMSMAKKFNRRSLKLITGGGIKNLKQIREIEEAGFHGALISTALHDGSIAREDIQEWID